MCSEQAERFIQYHDQKIPEKLGTVKMLRLTPKPGFPEKDVYFLYE
jgi:hypothetical protein